MTNFIVTFREVPLIPPIECSDLKSWIAERIYEMGANDARAGLAEQPVWPTDEDLYDLADEFDGEPVAAMRRALELWGTPTAQPEPPSLKEQALEVFEALIHGDASGLDVGVIRRALEALPND
jgi:hypothetical protein